MTILEFLKENPLIEYTPAADEFVTWSDTFVDEELNVLYTIIKNSKNEVIHYFENPNPSKLEDLVNLILEKYKNLT